MCIRVLHVVFYSTKYAIQEMTHNGYPLICMVYLGLVSYSVRALASDITELI